MTKPNFIAAIAVLFGTFGTQLSDEAAEGYWIGLQDMTDEQIRSAVARALRESKFMPRPAELREFAGIGSKAKALIAWDRVRWAMRKYGYTTSVDFGPLVNAVVRNMGGWQRLDEMPTKELDVWGKKEFERVYDLLATKNVETLNRQPLRGAFGGDVVQVAIEGVTPPKQLESRSNGVSQLVQQLAEGKS